MPIPHPFSLLQIHLEAEIHKAAPFPGFVSDLKAEFNGQDGEQNELVGQGCTYGCPCLSVPGIPVKSAVPAGTIVYKKRALQEIAVIGIEAISVIGI